MATPPATARYDGRTVLIIFGCIIGLALFVGGITWLVLQKQHRDDVRLHNFEVSCVHAGGHLIQQYRDDPTCVWPKGHVPS